MQAKDKLDIINAKALNLGLEGVIIPSTRKNKKYMAIYEGKKIHFGDNRYEDYLDHKNEDRRAKYLNRSKKIKNKKGEYTYLLKTSPNFYSVNLLW